MYSNTQLSFPGSGYACCSRSRQNGHSIEAYTDTSTLQELKETYRQTMVELESTTRRLEETRRQRIALYRSKLRARTRRELHDLLGHGLTLILLLLRSASVYLNSGPDKARSLLGTALGEAYQGSKLNLEIQCRGMELPLPNALIQQLERCVQEGLANAIKHADPSTMFIGVSFKPEKVSLSLVNDGSSKKVLRFGQGLQMMEDRLREFGGSLHACSDEAGGFILSLTVPLPDKLA